MMPKKQYDRSYVCVVVTTEEILVQSTMASQSEPKTLEFPRNFYVGHMIGRKGQTISDMEELTGATIKVVPGCRNLSGQNIQILGTPDAIELAEELIMALFKYENPNEFSDGLKKIVVISKLHQLLPPNSVLATKVLSLLAACQ